MQDDRQTKQFVKGQILRSQLHSSSHLHFTLTCVKVILKCTFHMIRFVRVPVDYRLFRVDTARKRLYSLFIRAAEES